MVRVKVKFKPTVIDARGNLIKREIVEDLKMEIEAVKTVDVYTIDAELDDKKRSAVAKNLLADPLIQAFDDSVDSFSKTIEVGFKPGVTDNVGRTAVEAIEDLLGTKFEESQSVYTSKYYLLQGEIEDADAKKIATGLLANPLIEYFHIFDESYLKEEEELVSKMEVKEGKPRINYINLDVEDNELMRISKEGVLSLDLAEMKKIRDYYKDERVVKERTQVGLPSLPSDVELEMLAQTWSEHCKHKIFNGLIEYDEDGKVKTIDSLFNTYIRKATDEIAKLKKEFLVSVFVDNAGVIGLNDDYNLVFKVETHNHPSALDPYGGAITGIVGVNRDPMGTGLGAQLIFNTDVFCFGPPDFPYEKLPEGILHPKRIFRGVRLGVEHGGNKIGIPTVNGALLFDEAYVYNPLVYCGTGGIMPKKIAGRLSHKKKACPGDLIVMVGGRIGKDGIHGATFSSTKLEETTSPTAVQIGAPIVQKKMMDALLEARDRGLYNSITDNGAGGLSSSIGEMARESGGAKVYLEKAPVKYLGLNPWELWLSEAQERMTVAVPPERIDEFLDLMKRRDTEATVLGEYNESSKIYVTYEGKTVCYLDMDFLHGGLPRTKKVACFKSYKIKEPKLKEPLDLKEILKSVLSSLNVCSKEWVIRQYDHEVQGTSVIKPLTGKENDGPSDAAVLKPLYESKCGVIVANGINPRYGLIDTYSMAASAIDEAIRNIVAVGGDVDRIALLDNFCWGNPIKSDENPDGDFKLGQLVRAAQACYDVARVFETPFISGKDSFHNEYQVGDKTISIPPTLLISSVGVIDDVEKVVTMDVKKPGDLVYILGDTLKEMGGSHFLLVLEEDGGELPRVYPKQAKKLYKSLGEAIRKGFVSSAHDCSEGGMVVALAESSFAGGYGIKIDLEKVKTKEEMENWEILFSESNSRFVATVKPEYKEEFEEILDGIPFSLIGGVREDSKFLISNKDQKIMEASIDELKEAWKVPLRW